MSLNKNINNRMNKLSNMKIESLKITGNDFYKLLLNDKSHFQLPKSKNLFKISDFNGNKKFKLSYYVSTETETKLNEISNLLKEELKLHPMLKNKKLELFLKDYKDQKYLNLNVVKHSKFGIVKNKKVEIIEKEELKYAEYKSLIYMNLAVVGNKVYLRFNITEIVKTKDQIFEKQVPQQQYDNNKFNMDLSEEEVEE